MDFQKGFLQHIFRALFVRDALENKVSKPGMKGFPQVFGCHEHSYSSLVAILSIYRDVSLLKRTQRYVSSSFSILERSSSRTRRYTANCSSSVPTAFEGSSSDQCRRRAA